MFNDASLNALVESATTNNQSLRAALARFDQARAAARVNKGEFLPSLDFNPKIVRERFSNSQIPDFNITHATTLRAPIDLSYEIDLWGRVRRSFEGARADAQASAADFHNVLLSVQTEAARRAMSCRPGWMPAPRRNLIAPAPTPRWGWPRSI